MLIQGSPHATASSDAGSGPLDASLSPGNMKTAIKLIAQVAALVNNRKQRSKGYYWVGWVTPSRLD